MICGMKVKSMVISRPGTLKFCHAMCIVVFGAITAATTFRLVSQVAPFVRAMVALIA